MKLLSILPQLLAVAVSAVCQTNPPTSTDRVELTADKVTHEGAIIRGTGHVRAKFGAFVLEGDEGSWRQDTGEVEVKGHARVVLPARPDRNWFRYDSSVVATENRAGLSADRLTVKNALLRGWGHVEVRAGDARMRSDEIEMFLNIGDARIRGNIKVDRTYGRAIGSGAEFPPDIIKPIRPMPPDIIR